MSIIEVSPPPFLIFNQAVFPNGILSNANYQIGLGNDLIFSYFQDSQNSENYIGSFELLTGRLLTLYRAGQSSGSIPNIVYLHNGQFCLFLNDTGENGSLYLLGECPPQYWKMIFDFIPDGAILNILLNMYEGALLTKKCLNANGTLANNSIMAECSPDNSPYLRLTCNVSMDSGVPAIIGTSSGFALLFNDGDLIGPFGSYSPSSHYFVDNENLYIENSDKEIYQCNLKNRTVTQINNPNSSYDFIGVLNGFIIMYSRDEQALKSYNGTSEVDSLNTDIVNIGDYSLLYFAGKSGIIGLGYDTNTNFFNQYQRFTISKNGILSKENISNFNFGFVNQGSAMIQPFYRNGEVGIMIVESMDSLTLKMFLLTGPYVKLNFTNLNGFLRCGC